MTEPERKIFCEDFCRHRANGLSQAQVYTAACNDAFTAKRSFPRRQTFKQWLSGAEPEKEKCDYE